MRKANPRRLSARQKSFSFWRAQLERAIQGQLCPGLKKVKDRKLKAKVQEVIGLAEQAQSLQEIENVKKLKGSDRYYRVRIGDYRIGLSVEGNVVTFVRFLHRKDVYRYFP